MWRWLQKSFEERVSATASARFELIKARSDFAVLNSFSVDFNIGRAAGRSDLADANCAAVAESSSRTDLKPSPPHCASEISTHCVCNVIDSADRASYRRFREESSKERTQEP